MTISGVSINLFTFAIALVFVVPSAYSATLDYNALYDQGNHISARSTGAYSNRSGPACGYESCPQTRPNKINVHLIAHTHDDVGWLKTVDQYYYGTRKKFSSVGVQYILDSVIPQLLMDRTKRFIYVEMSFFSKWWYEQDEPMKSIVRKLVDEGRLEFINGGWCMNDEATVTYHSTIEQMTLGLKFLRENFGPCGHPKVGWQIDPFGHTNEQASLFAQFGFDGMFFTRESFRDKMWRTEHKALDLMWHGDVAQRDDTGSIFTNIFRDGYDAPKGYCFDATCLDDVVVDNKNSYEYNIDYKGQRMISFIREYAQAKLTNHVLIPFGGDFQFSAAGQNFKSLDKLMDYIRANAPDINIFYSTPSCYQHSVYEYLQQNKLRLPEKFDDFMPYDSSPTVWWSGYFASRPSVKLIERETANLLQVARLVSLGQLMRTRSRNWVSQVKEHDEKCLTPLWEVLGDLQHHDAVTGTEKQHVADDYVRRAYDATVKCAKFMGDIRRKLLIDSIKETEYYRDHVRSTSKNYNLEPIFLEKTMFCPLLNISQCDALESEVDARSFIVDIGKNKSRPDPRLFARMNGQVPQELQTRSVLMTVYNPLAKPVSQHDIRLPCNGRCDLKKVKVINLVTKESMKLTKLPIPAGVLSLSFRDAKTTHEILFYADLAPLATTSFLIEDENADDVIDEDIDSPPLSTESRSSNNNRNKNINRNRRINSPGTRYEYFDTNMAHEGSYQEGARRRKREAPNSFSQQSEADRVVVKFDMSTGMITGLKRVSDGSVLNITQKFGYYFPAEMGHQPGAYIFRPNSTEPYLLEKPIAYKMFKRQNGALIEIHQKWSEWIWQTIRVDAKKNYIEFDYIVGPIPTTDFRGREIVTRYITNMANQGVFLTDSGARQLLPRQRLKTDMAEELGGSFYPVVSTIMLRDNSAQQNNTKNAEAVAILVDRAQAGTSLNEGEIELLVHRRQLRDDSFGVDEALNEPGEDGRGLVSRGKHRLYLKFHDLVPTDYDNRRDASNATSGSKLVRLAQYARANMTYEEIAMLRNPMRNGREDNLRRDFNYLVHDHVYNDLRQESIRAALKPIMTFDRLRVSAQELLDMLASSSVDSPIQREEVLLNTTLPNNVHLLTLQPWDGGKNEVLIRLENLDNPVTLHQYPNPEVFQSLLKSYQASSRSYSLDSTKACDQTYTRPEFDIEYMFNNARVVKGDELHLGADSTKKDAKRLEWTKEQSKDTCGREYSTKPTSISLGPRQIRTFLVRLEPLAA